MADALQDAVARARFRDEWDRNFAVSANAGSGKTTAISQRLAAIARAEDGGDRLRRTAVVTFTKKAAGEIEQRARQVLIRELAADGDRDLRALDRLERAFFGTIHSFCLQLARTHGQELGINLNPELVAEDDEALWEAFVEQDSMTFRTLAAAERAALLRHVPLEAVFDVARGLSRADARRLIGQAPAGLPRCDEAARDRLLVLEAKGSGTKNILASQRRAQDWQTQWERGEGFLPLYTPAGSAKAVVAEATEWMAPLKAWLAAAAATLAGELAERFRAWRLVRGVQTYADQIDAAMALLEDDALMDRIRAEGWRIILDEAQDTDPQQFAVLVEVARPPGAPRGTWPGSPEEGGVGFDPPRPGHFCLVGDGQQAIYGSRADIGNFRRHLAAFAQGDGGEQLEFEVTFRAPHAVIAALNATLPAAFGAGLQHNHGPGEAVGDTLRQVPYVPLAAGPANVPGAICWLPLAVPDPAPAKTDAWLVEEARQLAAWLQQHGPAAVGARAWGEVALLAPRNEWLLVVRRELEAAGLEVALQMRRNRSGDNPAYAWLAGLLAICADPENTFEWVGVLREVFGVSDGVIAAELRRVGRFAWEEPAAHEPVPTLAGALAAVRPFVLQTNDEGRALGDFVEELIAATGLVAKARAVDATGAVLNELDRLVAEAVELGLDGAGPREWSAALIAGVDDGRPAGKPSGNALNLLTCFSAKGLEWPVVIPVGLWRGIGKAPERGLRVVDDRATGTRVYFDGASVPADTQEARERERWRELTRLLYVTLTRPKRVLVLPWAEGFGGRQRVQPSFLTLWDNEPSAWPALDGGALDLQDFAVGELEPPEMKFDADADADEPDRDPDATGPLPPLPARLLPHKLAKLVDRTRAARHETGWEEPWPTGGEEAIDYGHWWHEALEFWPWAAADPAVAVHRERCLTEAAALGMRERGEREWAMWTESVVRRELSDARWQRRAELAVFAPLEELGWVDGVIDLVVHDPASGEVWVVDWKTNRLRAGETPAALLRRLQAEYAPQLRAYGTCLRQFFPEAMPRLWLYASAVGDWIEVEPDRGDSGGN